MTSDQWLIVLALVALGFIWFVLALCAAVKRENARVERDVEFLRSVSAGMEWGQ